ncbi:Origin recognition complex subunit 3 [Thoreauomyces humboldtii]|nr:Origin recognition complex subunit 3 [Thoreauomyces humboldtii]
MTVTQTAESEATGLEQNFFLPVLAPSLSASQSHYNCIYDRIKWLVYRAAQTWTELRWGPLSSEPQSVVHRKPINLQQSGEGDPAQLFNGQEPREYCQLRYVLFKERWQKMQGKIDTVLARLNSEAIEHIIDFVRTPRDDAGTSSRQRRTEIPTGLVFAGINTSDHERLFAQVATKMAAETSYIAATLPSTKCPTLKAATKSMMDQFLGSSDVILDEEEVGLDTPLTAQAPKRPQTAKLPNYDLQRLLGWHRLTGGTKTLVLIFPDFESFNMAVLHALIDICSIHNHDTPFVLLFGVATSVDVVHQSLSREALACLQIEKFELHQSRECVNVIIQEVLVRLPFNESGNPTSWKLGLETFEFLVDNFQLHTLSIISFTNALKYAMMDMYFSNPLSILLDYHRNASRWEQRMMIEELTDHHLLEVRMTKSFKKHIESIRERWPYEARELLEDDEKLKQWIVDSLDKLMWYHYKYPVTLGCVRVLQDAVNSPTLRKTTTTLHLMALQGNFVEHDHTVALLTLLRKRNLATLQSCLQGCLEQLQSEEWAERFMSDYISRIEELLVELATFAEDSESSEEDVNVELKRLQDIRKRAKEASRTTLASRRAKMLKETEVLEVGTLDSVAKKVTDFLEGLFRDCLRSYKEFALHEVLYYSNADRLKKAFHPQARAAVQTALGQTRHYVSCECCQPLAAQSQHDTIAPTLQDTSIAYRLYLECGRLINLYDWFVAFGTVLEKEGGDSRKGGAGGGGPARDEIQARFVKTIAELQLMGFIKPTTRKTDHVMRLTWGNGC